MSNKKRGGRYRKGENQRKLEEEQREDGRQKVCNYRNDERTCLVKVFKKKYNIALRTHKV